MKHSVELTEQEDAEELMFLRSQLQKVFQDQPMYLCLSTMAEVIEEMMVTPVWSDTTEEQRKQLAITTLEVLEVLRSRIKEHFQLP